MFAVVKIAGQQFKVQKDQEIFVQQLQGNIGDKVQFSEVLLTDNGGKLTVGTDVKSVVKA
jgi:large subunit ribosomal protein L21